MTHIGCLETADEIAEKLTTMYKWQIEQFHTSDKEPETTDQDQSTKDCGCAACCNSCIGSLKRTKNRITNER